MSQSYALQNPTPTPIPTPPRQPWIVDCPMPPPLPNTSDHAFLQSRCMFCSQTNHCIKECPLAHEYIRTGKAIIINNQIHLPNGQPIPANIMGINLQAKIDAWLAGTAATAPTHPSDASFVRNPPPHTTHCFEIVTEGLYDQPVQQAHIVEIPTVESESKDEDDKDNFDLFEVYATERKKRNTKTSQLPELAQVEESITPTAASPNHMQSSKTPHTITPPDTSSSSKDKDTQNVNPSITPTTATCTNDTPSSAPRAALQYCYQSNAEDQQLTSELYRWLLDGKLSIVTPAHILAACPAIRKELVECLRTRRVDTAAFEQSLPSESTPPLSILELSTPHVAKYSLPLREIDVLINNTVPKAGVLNQGSQIVVIQHDLAQEAGAHINYQHQLEMEGANGLVSRTLGCAENLTMQISDVAFEVHTHVVERAPFRLLLRQPFHHLLLC